MREFRYFNASSSSNAPVHARGTVAGCSDPVAVVRCVAWTFRYRQSWLGNLPLHLFSSGDLKQNSCAGFEWDIGTSFFQLVLMESTGSINKKHEMGVLNIKIELKIGQEWKRSAAYRLFWPLQQQLLIPCNWKALYINLKFWLIWFSIASLSDADPSIDLPKHDFPISKHSFQFFGRWVFMQTPNNCLASLVFSPFSATRGILGGRVGMCSPLSWANIQVSSSQVVMIERQKNVIRPWLSPMESQWHNWQSYYFRKMSLANSRRDVGVGIIMSYFIQLSTFPCSNPPDPTPPRSNRCWQ